MADNYSKNLLLRSISEYERKLNERNASIAEAERKLAYHQEGYELAKSQTESLRQQGQQIDNVIQQFSGVPHDREKLARQRESVQTRYRSVSGEMQQSQGRVRAWQDKLKEGGILWQEQQDRAQNYLQRSVKTAMGISERERNINQAAGSPYYIGDVMSAAGRSSFDILEKRDFLSSKAERIRESILMHTESTGLKTEEDMSQLKQLGESYNNILTRQGVLKGAMGEKRRRGEDVLGLETASREYADLMYRDLKTENIHSRIASGDVGSMKQEQQRLSELRTTFVELQKATNELKKDYKQNGKQIEANNAQLKELGEQYKDQKELLRGMGGGGGRMGNIFGAMGSIGQLISSGANTAQTIGVQQTLADVGNRALMAKIVNEQAADHLAALGGDMSALRRIGSGTYEMIGEKANAMGSLTSKTTFWGGAGKITSGIGIGGGAFLAGPVAGSIASAAIAAPLVSSGVEDVADWWRDVSKFQKIADSYNVSKKTQDEMYRVFDQSSQAYRNFMGGATVATRGGGHIRGEVWGALNSKDVRGDLQRLGVSQEQMMQLAQGGIGAIGADFRSSMITRAGELQKAGFLTGEQYMGAMGQLNQVGGMGSMETILKNAVSSGMDTSKNLLEMVSGIKDMAAADAVRGLQTAGGAAALMGVAVDAEGVRELPAGMRTNIARLAGNITRGSMTDSSMNMFNVAEFGALRRAVPDASMAQLTRLQSLSPTELAGLDKEENIRKLGLTGLLMTTGEDGTTSVNTRLVNLIREISGNIELDKQTSFFATGGQKKLLQEALKTGRSLQDLSKDPKYSAVVDTYSAMMSQHADPDAMWAVVQGVTYDKRADGTYGPQRKIGAEGKTGDKTLDGAENILAEKWISLGKTVDMGQDIMDKVYGGLETFSKNLSKLGEEYAPEDYQERAAGAARDLKLDVKTFNTAVGNFQEAVQDMRKALGLSGQSSDSDSKNSMRKRREGVMSQKGFIGAG